MDCEKEVQDFPINQTKQMIIKKNKIKNEMLIEFCFVTLRKWIWFWENFLYLRVAVLTEVR